MRALLRVMLSVFVSMSLFAGAVRAEPVSTDEVAAGQAAASDREKVRAFIDRAGVQEKLKTMGVEGIWAKHRVDAMTDQEVAMLAQKIDSLPAGAALSSNDLIIILLVAILVIVAL